VADKFRHILKRFSFAPMAAVISSLSDLPKYPVGQQ